MVTITSQEIKKRDSIDEWRRKTNLLIQDAANFSVLVGVKGSLSEQFKKIEQSNDQLTIGEGLLRVKNIVTLVPEKTISHDALAMVYVDIQSLDTQPIKSISILESAESYGEISASFIGQALFTFSFTPNPTSSVWLNGVELQYGAMNDYIISGNSIILNDPSSVEVGSKVFAANTDMTAYNALTDILPLYKATINATKDLRTWAITNRNTEYVFPSVPAELYYQIGEPTQEFDIAPVSTRVNIVYVDGVRQIENIDYIATTANKIRFTNPVPADSKVIIIGRTQANEFEVVTLVEELVATASQTNFTFGQILVTPTMAVWIDGIRQSPNTAYTVDSNTNELILSNPVPAGTKVFAATNVPSNGSAYFYGGTTGQIAVRNSSSYDDWSWQTPSFDISSFSGTFSASVLPLGGNIFSSYIDDYYVYSPYGLFINAARVFIDLIAWEKREVSNISDFILTGNTRNGVRGGNFLEGTSKKYNEYYVSQKCGRIFRNPFDGNIDSAPVPNAPHDVNAIAACKIYRSNGYTFSNIPPIKYLLVGGDSGKMSYSENILYQDSAKGAIFIEWKELTTSAFTSEWDIVDILPFMDGVVEYIFVSAYNKTTNKSCVKYKLSNDVLNNNISWTILSDFGETGLSGTITRFAYCAKVWSGTYSGVTSIPLAYFGIGERAYRIDSASNTLVMEPIVSYESISGKTIVDMFGVTKKSKLGSGSVEKRSWFAVTSDGKLYRKETVNNSNPVFSLAKNLPCGKILGISAIGHSCINDNNDNRLKYLIFCDNGAILEFKSSDVVGSEAYRVAAGIQTEGDVVFATYFDDNTEYDSTANGFGSYTQRMIIQDSTGATYNLRNFESQTDVTYGRYTQKPFVDDDGFIPPVGASVVISNGSVQIFVAKPPINCLWVLENTKQGGKAIPLSGNVLGGFYEQGKFIVVTSRYIYSSSNGYSWTKEDYTPNFDNREYVDITSSNINGNPTWVLANGDDSAYSNNGTNWTKLRNPKTGYYFSAGMVTFQTPTNYGFKTAYGATTANGAVYGQTYKGQQIGYLYPNVTLIGVGSYNIKWQFNIRDITNFVNTDVSDIKIRGVFLKKSTNVVLDEIKTLTLTPTNFSITTNTAASGYGSNWELSGDNDYVLVDGNIYEMEINDGTANNVVFPYRCVTSNIDNTMFGVDVDGYLITSVDAQNWSQIPNQTIDVFNVFTQQTVGTTDLQYDGVTAGRKYLSVQAAIDGGYIASRENGQVMSYFNQYSVKEYIPNSFGYGIVDLPYPFTGNPIIDMYGKFFIFCRTQSGKLYTSIAQGADTGSGWLNVVSPLNSDDVPSAISYDSRGNYFLTVEKYNNKEGNKPVFYQSKF